MKLLFCRPIKRPSIKESEDIGHQSPLSAKLADTARGKCKGDRVRDQVYCKISCIISLGLGLLSFLIDRLENGNME